VFTPMRAWASQPLKGLDDAQTGAHGALGVVLMDDRRAENTDHGVADELLDRAVVTLDRSRRPGEVLPEERVHVLRVRRLVQRREAHEVAEERRDHLSLFGDERWASEKRAALAAESPAFPVPSPTRRTDRRHSSPSDHRTPRDLWRHSSHGGDNKRGRCSCAHANETTRVAPSRGRRLRSVRGLGGA
jgi:hypothetical protein